MASAPEPVTLRPITLDDLSVGAPVHVRRDHAGEPFYVSDFTIKQIDVSDILSSGTSVPVGTVSRLPVVGQEHRITVRSASGNETQHSLMPAEVFDAKFPAPADGSVSTERQRMIARQAGHHVAVLADPSHPDSFSARLVPIWGAEVNVRVVVEDADPDEIAQVVSDAITKHVEKARVARAQARTVEDLRVNVSEIVLDADYKPTDVLRGVNVLRADVIEFMRNAGQGSISTMDVPYGQENSIVIGR